MWSAWCGSAPGKSTPRLCEGAPDATTIPSMREGSARAAARCSRLSAYVARLPGLRCGGAEDRYRQYRLDAEQHRPGAADDRPRPRPFLCRNGAQEERAGDAHAVLRDLLSSDGDVVRDRLQ